MTRTPRPWITATLLWSLGGCGLHGRPEVERRDRRSGEAALERSPEEPNEPSAVVAPGIVEPWGDSVGLSSQEPGWIAVIAVREGQEVTTGQELAVLDDGPQRAALEIARAELLEAKASLSRVLRGATREELDEARAAVEAARARGELAQSRAQRATRLVSLAVIPDEQAERAAAEARAELAQLAGAESRLLEVRRGARAEERRAAAARVEAASARVSLAETNLARRHVLAPASGTILTSRFHPGELVGPASGPLFILGDLTRLQVRLEVDEIDAHDVAPGGRCRLFSDGGRHLAEGTVARLAPRMGRRALPLESPTARADVRVREVFVEVPATVDLIPGQRVWGHADRVPRSTGARP